MVVDGNGQYGLQCIASSRLCGPLGRNENAVERPRQGQYRLGRRKDANNIAIHNSWFAIITCLLVFLASTSNAAFIAFDNCLESDILSDPTQLQFVPAFFSVVYDTSPGPNPLNITIYGNVTGAAQGDTAPTPGSPQWANSSETAGKIVNIVDNNGNLTYTTLFTTLDILSYTPYEQPTEFCSAVIQGSCPLGPVFDVNANDPSQLRAFAAQHDLQSSYQFTTFASTLRIKSGDIQGTDLACVSGIITPDLGGTLRGALGFIPLLILVFLTVANILAATYSPWGSTDIFRWTSNYGRDEDLLRLVTPGFADCLQYIQFIVLTGALSLSYPGFFQPITAQGSWSILMFNQSLVSHGGMNPVVDGVYVVNGGYGMDRLRQYVGMNQVDDIWPGSIVWLLVILALVTILTQVAFGIRWVYHKLAHVPEEDLRAKNIPFTIGNIIRITFNFFLLPTLSLSFFQLVVAPNSPAYSVALAAVLILVLAGFAFWMIRLIISARPRAYLFDDLSTVLLYGPLYNTYCDGVAPFALVPVFITFLRSIAIGALQPSGVAQVVLLAICEVANILLLVAFHPYPSPTSMNIYQIIFSIVRFLVVLLSVAFVPSLGISEQTKGWIGYAILILHAGMLVFGFFLNALQTLIEVIARLAGAGGAEGGATRGGLSKVFGARQLSRRNPRSSTRQSMASDAAILANMDERSSTHLGGSRARSLSGSSAMLLNRNAISDGRISIAYDAGSAHGGVHSRSNSGMYTPTTPGAVSASFSHSAGYQPMGTPKNGSVIGFKPETMDPYYRPPRPRTKTLETQQSGDGGRSQAVPGNEIEDAALESAGQPVPAHLGGGRDDSDLDDARPNRKDYAVREVDFYYRVRGPALSHTGTRKLKTGPADPTRPVSSASGWFRRLLGGKTKEEGKGFEVIRSARAPPTGLLPPAEDEEYHEPYRDEPGSQSPDEGGGVGHSRNISGITAASSYHDSDDAEEDKDEPPRESYILPQIDAGGSIELPSRIGSRSSTTSSASRPPVPRKSSKRHGQEDSIDEVSSALLPIPGSPTSAAHVPHETLTSDLLHAADESEARLPFAPSESGSKTSRERNESVASRSSTIQRVASAEPGQPSGMGYVAHHRAGANIHDVEHPMAGSTAELVEQGTDTESDRERSSQ